MTDRKTIVDLRTSLFSTMDRLMAADNPMEVDRARAVVEVAQAIINSAKVEVDYLRATGVGGSGFIEATKGIGRSPELPASAKGGDAMAGVTRHLIGE